MNKPEYSWEGDTDEGYVILAGLTALQPYEVIQLLNNYWELLELSTELVYNRGWNGPNWPLTTEAEQDG